MNELLLLDMVGPMILSLISFKDNELITNKKHTITSSPRVLWYRLIWLPLPQAVPHYSFIVWLTNRDFLVT